MSDMISRWAVRLIESDSDAYPQEWNDDYEKGFTDAVNKVLALPSVQPETPPYVAEIESEYKKWVSIPDINKPLAKALYEVWKKHDREDVSRNG